MRIKLKKNQDMQGVSLNSFIKSLKFGLDETICDEMALLLVRAGTVSRLND